MSLRNLPKIKSFKQPDVMAFAPRDDALQRFNGAIMAAAGDAFVIDVLDVIGEDFWSGEGVTAKRIGAALAAAGGREVTVNVNSPGGDFFEGVAIYNLLRDYPAKVTVRILGIAASAASVIAMAGDEIQIGKAGFIMVHNAWTVVVGNRHDLSEAIKVAEPFDEAMAAVYADRSGQEKSVATTWMDAETWFNGAQAVEQGLADLFLDADVVSEDREKSSVEANTRALRRTEAAYMKSGMSRSERRALLADMGGKPGAVPDTTQDAGEIMTMLNGLRTTIRS